LSPEGAQVLRTFLRRWSTIDLDEFSRPVLIEELLYVRSLLLVFDCDQELLVGAESASDRQWFAKRFSLLEK
jgi:hypothetical protein